MADEANKISVQVDEKEGSGRLNLLSGNGKCIYNIINFQVHQMLGYHLVFNSFGIGLYLKKNLHKRKRLIDKEMEPRTE